MRRNGYDSYRGRSRFRTALKVLIGVLAVLLVLAVAALIWLEPYIDYSAGGIRINLPFFQREQPEATGSAPVVVATPEATPTPAPTPEPKENFRAVLLPNTALYDGTAEEQLQAAGANAAVFDMKADDGTLGYISGLALAEQAQVSAADPALNAAIQLLNDGDITTVARVSCFRDNSVPYYRNSLALHTSGGNWRDGGSSRWLSPASAEARQYVADVCRELAGLGFDELLLDNWAFPSGGAGILADDNYPAADGRTAVLEGFLDELAEALADYPEVRLSLVTTSAAAAGEAPETGQTAALLERADRVLVSLEEGETLPQLDGPSVIPILDRDGEAADSWAVLTRTETTA